MRARRAVAEAILIAAGAVAGLSCTALSDWDEVEQCTKNSDCANKYGDQYASYTCQDNICVDLGAIACTDDASCQARGGVFEDNLCDPETKKCVEPECKEAKECSDLSATATCKDGRCIDEVWGCLTGPALADSPTKLKVQGPVIDFSFGSERVRMQASAKLCRIAPPGCMPPVSITDTDPQGLLSVMINNVLPKGFDGYVRIEAEGYMPTEFTFPRPLRRDFVVDDTSPFAMLTPETIDAFTAIFPDVEIDPLETALLTLRLYDCQDNPAEGVRLTTDLPGARFYITDEAFLPNLNASATDEAGIAGLANVQAGSQVISVIYNPTGEELYHFNINATKATFLMGFLHAKDIRTDND